MRVTALGLFGSEQTIGVFRPLDLPCYAAQTVKETPIHVSAPGRTPYGIGHIVWVDVRIVNFNNRCNAWKGHALANLPFDRNALLAQLDASDRAKLNDSAELVNFEINELMYEVDERIEDIWFPISGMISVVTDMQDGGSVEVCASGREGVIGFEGYLGSKISRRKQMGQIKGQAIVMPLRSSKPVFCQGKGLKALLLFIHAQIIEASQGAACNRIHSAEERLARWLLATRDRIESDTLTLTHEFLAMMLGARRSTVSLSAAKFQAAGMIEYRRGHIKIIDAQKLEDVACECYRVIRAEQLN